jgi:predicted  nucleic acid-binding Zn-ribbon protein
MRQAQALYELQQIELGILRAQRRMAEIDALLNDSAAVAQAREQRDRANNALVPLRAKARDLERDIQAAVDKSVATEQSLYSGSVTSPKAMQDMQHEIESLKRRRAELEDHLLEAMLALEDAEAALAQAEDTLEQAIQEAAAKHGDLAQERDTLTRSVTTLEAQRQSALPRVDTASLKLYNAIKPRRANQPVAVLDGQTCTACGVEQTMAVASEARMSDKLITCTSCGRILYVKA